MGEDGEEIVGDDSDDFIVLRRDVNAGRPVMSGPVLYSVAESVAQPRWNIARPRFVSVVDCTLGSRRQDLSHLLIVIEVAFLCAHGREDRSLMSSGRYLDDNSLDRALISQPLPLNRR